MDNFYFKTSDLTVGYNKKPLIKDININVGLGEIVTMIGPNGAGKSTILKSITKHLEIIDGDALIADASLSHMNYKKLAQQLSVVLTDKIKGELLTCFDVVSTGRYPYTNSLGILDENDKQTKFESIFVTHSEAVDVGILDGQIKKLLEAKPEQIVEILKEIVPEFNHNNKG